MVALDNLFQLSFLRFNDVILIYHGDGIPRTFRGTDTAAFAVVIIDPISEFRVVRFQYR